MNHEHQNQHQEGVHGHGNHWWHMLLCLAMVGAFFFLGARDKNTAPISLQGVAPATESYFVEQRGEMGDVTIIALPRRVEDGLAFDLTFDTHSGELDFDAARAAALVDASGKEIAPREWSGNPAGGHHRKITTFFDALPEPPFTLLIRDVGNVAEQMFTFE